MSERRITPTRIDNQVAAEVIGNDLLMMLVAESGGDLEQVNMAIGQHLQILADEVKGAQFMQNVLPEYTEGAMPVFALAGVTIDINSGAIQNHLIQNLSLFKSLPDTKQKHWMKEVGQGKRLSRESLPPMPTSPAI